MDNLEIKITTPADLSGAKEAVKVTEQLAKASKESGAAARTTAADLAKNVVATQQMDLSTKTLLGSLKQLSNQIPGLGLVITALKNPVVGLAAAFAAVVDISLSLIQRVRDSIKAIEAFAIETIRAKNAADDWQKSLQSNVKTLRDLQAESEAYEKSKQGSTPGLKEQTSAKIKAIDERAAVEKAALSAMPDSPAKRAQLQAIDQAALRDKSAVMTAAGGEAASAVAAADVRFAAAGRDIASLKDPAERARKVYNDYRAEHETLFKEEEGRLNKARRAKDKFRPGSLGARQADKIIADIEGRRAARTDALRGFEGAALSLEEQLGAAQAERQSAAAAGTVAAEFGRESTAAAAGYTEEGRTSARTFTFTESQAIRNDRAAAQAKRIGAAQSMLEGIGDNVDMSALPALTQALRTLAAVMPEWRALAGEIGDVDPEEVRRLRDFARARKAARSFDE